jgi:hypothetical protein
VGVKVTASAFDRFELPPQGPPMSRYQTWKFQVDSGRITIGGAKVDASPTIGPNTIVPVPVG